MKRAEEDWKLALEAWQARKSAAKALHPIQEHPLPRKMEQIHHKDRKFLRLKALWYLLRFDQKRLFQRFYLKQPLRLLRLLFSYIRGKSYRRKGDFFLYGLTEEELQTRISDPSLPLLLGFSYCEKPHECPSLRFSDQCMRDPTNLVCQQCSLFLYTENLPPNTEVVFIPTVHHIGEKLLQNSKSTFLITACELTLEMFGDWAKSVRAKGVGIRLDGRICNTMRAFELSEKGVKPGLTQLLPQTKEQLLRLLSLRKGLPQSS